ncbi:MAG: hypothetical protein LBK75_03065 [Oscillospiraceae bacterium]|jgi:enterochelin esterase-like enzyme|nr:hypothetical protein [Oscillospiraceae bacterium]
MKRIWKNKMPVARLLVVVLAACMMIGYIPAAAETQANPGQEKSTVLKVGAGMKDITPTADMYPITWGGVGGRGYAFIGAAERIYVRVIAMQNDDGPIYLMVSFDTGKGPYVPDMMDAVAAETGVAVEHIFWSTTHTHSVPENKAENWSNSLALTIREDTVANNLGDRSNQNNSRWAKLCQKQLVGAARDAIAGMAEAEVGMAVTQSNINVNRDTKFTTLAGTNSETAEGFNGQGPSDKTLTTLEFRSKDTKEPIAFIVHYAMHNVLLYANDYFNPGYEGINYTVNAAPITRGDYGHDDVDDIVPGSPAELNVAYCETYEYVENATVADGGIVVGNAAVHPDIGGQVSQYVEYNHPGAVALWLSGAAGDQNPVLRNCMNYPAPYDMEVGLKAFKAGAPVELTMKGGLLQACTYYASIQYVDVKRALTSIEEYQSGMPISRAYGTTDVPNKDGATSTVMYLTVLRLGDITFAGSPGELYNGIGVAMRDNAKAPNVLVVNHCWPYETNSGQSYFPDDVAQNNNSYRKANYQIGVINDYMTALVDQLYQEAGPTGPYALTDVSNGQQFGARYDDPGAEITEGAVLLIAQYNAAGRLIRVDSAGVAKGVPQTRYADKENACKTAKAFIWNGDTSPLEEALTLTLRYDMVEGVTVERDPDGPTGYKATFVYKNATAQNVRFFGDCMWFAKEDYEPASSYAAGTDGNTYFGEMFTPYQWEKGMFPMHVQANNNNRYNNTKYYTEMTKDDAYWTVSIPLPSGAFKYCYYVDSTLTTNAGSVTYINTNTGTKVLDPANLPLQNPISGNYANFSTVYVPFDPDKQDDDRSIELPIDDPAKQGTVVFERITGVTTAGSNPNVDIGVYLPPAYDDSGATTYKVFYLSHGGGGHERDWTHDGVMPNIMDHMIAEGRIDPKTLVVAVNFGSTGTGGNTALVMEQVQRDYVIPLLESKYHASTEVKDRAYAGLSRGGRIAADMMVDAGKDPSLPQYGTWGVWAPQDVPTDNTEFPVGAADKPIDVIRTLSAGAVAELNKVNIIIDSGAQDKRHVITSEALIQALGEKGVETVRGLYPNGGHDWMCWPKNLVFFLDRLWEGKVYKSI